MWLLCLFAAACSSALAAPPTLTHLHPAGAQRGSTIEVAAAGSLDSTAKFWVSDRGLSIEATDKGKLRVAVAKDALPGVYWLRAFNAEGASGLRPFIVGTLPEVMEKEANDEPKKAQDLTGPAIVNGKLEKNGDVDCYAVNLKKGQTLVASLEAHDTLRSPIDAMLQILTADGFVLDENNDFHGLDPQVAFTAKADGTYLARVFAFPATPDASIRFFGSDASIYRLTLTTGPFADHVLPLAVRAGEKTVEAAGWNLSPNTRMLTLAEGRPGGSHAIASSVDAANSLRVRTERHPTFRAATSGPLAPPVSLTGRIEKPGGEVLVPFDGKKGQALSIQVESRSFGLLVNPVVRILGAKPEQLARAEPGKLNTDTTLAFTPPADGRYTIAVSDLFDGGGQRHVFLLRVLSEPDYELTLTTDRFTIAPGKPTTIPVKINRLLGFNHTVEVAVEGLPDDVKLEVTKPAKPDPNTITLSLSARKPWSGPFRLVGKVMGEPKLTRTARAPIAEFDETTADLWLTATAPAKR